MDNLVSTDIPAWLVGLFMVYTGLIWYITRKAKIRMDSRIFALTLILEGFVYGIVFQLFNVNTELRGFFSRLMIIILCLSQSLPLTVSYMRSRHRDT